MGKTIGMDVKEFSQMLLKIGELEKKLQAHEAHKKSMEYEKVTEFVDNLNLFRAVQELVYTSGSDLDNLQNSDNSLDKLYVQAYENIVSKDFTCLDDYLCNTDGSDIVKAECKFLVRAYGADELMTVRDYYFSIVNKYTDEFYLLDTEGNIVKMTKVDYI